MTDYNMVIWQAERFYFDNDFLEFTNLSQVH